MSQLLIEEFKGAYANMMAMDLSALDRLYSTDVIFRDPIHMTHGLAEMQDYFASVMANVAECRFEFLDQLCSDEAAYLKWNMHYRHPRLAGGALLVVRGMSQIQFRDRIYFHEDSYDLGQMLYEHLPVAGGVIRWLKHRLAS